MAARTGRAKASDWKSWADIQIANSNTPDLWLVEMSLANSVIELRKAIDLRMRQEPICESYEDNAALGYIWQRYEHGELGLLACLKAAGKEADGSSSVVECESIYSLLNALETGADQQSISTKARNLFSSSLEASDAQWQAIQSGIIIVP